MKRIVAILLVVFQLTSFIKAQIIDINFNEVNLNCTFKNDSSKYVIRNDNELYKYTGCSFMEIDINFKNYTIIGVNGTIGGCSLPSVDFKIQKDYDKKTYYIDAIVYSEGSCRRNNPFRRFVYTEKLDENYNIIFDLKKCNK